MVTSGRTARLRLLAFWLTAAVVLALSPSAGRTPVGAQDQALVTACPVEAPTSTFADREGISDAHRSNVDCAASFEIVQGFEDGTYRPRLAVRRDQMASFIARTLDAAGVELPQASGNAFTDVTSGPHLANINRLAEAGIVEGGPLDRPESEFGPGLETRRDQMASFIVRAAGYAFGGDINLFYEATQRFDDVPPGNTHFGKVNFADEAGLAQGFADGLFRPGVSTLRDQMASFVVRLLSFLAVPVNVDLEAPESGTVSETVAARATVTDQFDRPFPGEAVAFTTDETTVPESATVRSNTNGQADFSFTSMAPETVTITAQIDGLAGEFPDHNFREATGDSGQAAVVFRPGVDGSGQTITLTASPMTAQAVVEQVTFTATVRGSGSTPLADQLVSFRAAGAIPLPPAGAAVTDTDGRATFQLTSATPGQVTVTATVGTGSTARSASVTVTFVALPL